MKMSLPSPPIYLLIITQMLFPILTPNAFGIRPFTTTTTTTSPTSTSSSSLSSSLSSSSISSSYQYRLYPKPKSHHRSPIVHHHRTTSPSTRSSLYAGKLPATIWNPLDGDDGGTNDEPGVFDPLKMSSSIDDWSSITRYRTEADCSGNSGGSTAVSVVAASAAASGFLLLPVPSANAAAVGISSGAFDPNAFRPICPASDSLYRLLQSTTQSVIGPSSYIEYGPLIAGGLLRVRLELCVVESFFGEAIVPFIQREGLGWVLPLRETVETFLAGTIFALATTFILVGGSKVLSVVVTYSDAFVGFPCRVLGGFGYDRARGVAVTWDVGFGPWKKRLVGPPVEKKKGEEEEEGEGGKEWLDWSKAASRDLPFVVVFGAIKAVGETSKVTREVTESVDLFIGRYLTLIATGYIGIKFLHFKVFPDFPF